MEKKREQDLSVLEALRLHRELHLPRPVPADEQEKPLDTVGRNKKIIAEHIRNQLEEDYAADQISIKEYVDPFTGDKNKKA